MITLLIGFLVYWFSSGRERHRKKRGDDNEAMMCSFEGEDLFNKRVYTKSGTLVLPDTQDVCSNCVQYVFKDPDGCVPLGYDETQNEPVCIAGFRNASGNWSVPPAKKC